MASPWKRKFLSVNMQILIKTLILSASFLAFASCKDQKVNDKTSADLTTADINILSTGYQLVSQNCISCHQVDPTKSNISAPSIQEIGITYHERYKNQHDFSKAMSDFLLKPSINKFLMEDAVKQYGMMPNMGYSQEQANAVSAYLFQNDFSKRDWYTETFIKDKKRFETIKIDTLSDLEKGKAIAMTTKATLGKNLLQAIKEKGTKGAIYFCNLKALSLTDSTAVALDAKVRRVTDKPRNPSNSATPKELEVITQMKKEMVLGKDPHPSSEENDHKYTGYYPIITNTMCLQCHGEAGKDVPQEIISTINGLYPEDKAVGYTENALRGIWVVEYEKN